MVESTSKQFHMPQLSSMDATYHAAQDIIYTLQNPAPTIPLIKLGHGHKEEFKTLAKVLRPANPAALPPGVPVGEVGQKKLQEMNQEVTQMKSTPQSNPVTNAKLLRVPIVGAYPDELQQVTQTEIK